MLIYILSFTFLASIISLLLVSVLLLNRKIINQYSFYLVSFGAGALLAAAFMDTLKEALELGGESVYLWVTFAVGGFFFIERIFHFFHHQDDDEDEKLKLPVPFLLFGDALHNFIDGVSIATSFLVSIPLGIVTSVAVFVHEIPHELGDFGILLHKGWGRMKVLKFNIATGFASIIGALLAFFLGSAFKHIIPLLLAITTANFIYLSATNLLPEIHHKAKKDLALIDVSFFFLGIIFVTLLIRMLG